MLSAEISSDLLNTFLDIDGKVSLANEEVVIVNELAHAWILFVKVLECLVGAVLAHVLTWENEAVVIGGLERLQEMDPLDVDEDFDNLTELRDMEPPGVYTATHDVGKLHDM